MELKNFFSEKPEGLQIDLRVKPTWKTNSIGTSFFIVTLTNGETVGIHQDSVKACHADCDKEGRISSDWEVSKSKVLFKKEKRSSTSPWEF